ncbi:MAG: NADH-quinone oxidoreductase subunit J [Woeseiales bacterium]
MLFHAILFYVFAAVLVGAALGVIFARNPVHAVMFLVLAFFQSAMLWLLIEAEFLAIVLVLFLFVVMMLDINIERGGQGYTRYWQLGLAIAGLMVFELIQIIMARGSAAGAGNDFSVLAEGYSNTKALGAVLYTEHVYAFEIAAVILLLAIISAITLTMRKRPGLKQQDISAQVAVKASDRIRIVKMASEGKETES